MLTRATPACVLPRRTRRTRYVMLAKAGRKDTETAINALVLRRSIEFAANSSHSLGSACTKVQWRLHQRTIPCTGSRDQTNRYYPVDGVGSQPVKIKVILALVFGPGVLTSAIGWPRYCE